MSRNDAESLSNIPAERLREVLPLTAAVSEDGTLSIGGVGVRDLAERFGTPLYIYDEHTIRQTCRDYLREYDAQMHGARAHYAGKAWLSPALVRILVEEGFGLDVVSAGELHVALAGGMDPEHIAFHGNGKTRAELEYALDNRVGRIILDNDDELALLDELTRERAVEQRVMLRITPGVDAQTHAKTTTGLRDSKFGFPLPSGQAEAALVRAIDAPFLDLTGLHIHLGSPLFNTDPYAEGIATIAEFAREMKERHGYEWREFSPGGGMALTYTADQLAPETDRYAVRIAEALYTACDAHGLAVPSVHIEPGRSVVGRAGVALYTVVSRKHIPDTRDYLTVDGGMSDNIRPAMYDSRYEAAAAERMLGATQPDGHGRGQVLRERRRTGARRAVATAHPRRAGHNPRQRRIPDRDGEQLQPLPPPRSRDGQRGRSASHPPPPDLRRPAHPGVVGVSADARAVP